MNYFTQRKSERDVLPETATPAKSPDLLSTFGPGMMIIGNVVCTGTLQVLGRVTGDIHAAHLPRIEVHGTAGSLGVPDPNGFEGPVELFTAGSWQPLPVSAGYRGAGRGTGLADLAAAVAADRPHLASGELAEHVLDVMLTLLDAAHEGRSLPVASTW